MSGSKWVRVSRTTPCPICGHPDFCTLSIDGTTVHCQRVASDKKCPGDSGGWLHRHPEGVAPPKPDKKPVAKIKDVGALAEKFFYAAVAQDRREKLGASWGVSTSVLGAMMVGVGYDERGHEFLSFPSRDADGKIVGIIRRYESGKKLTYPGTSNGGVFVIPGWYQRQGPVFVVEGASDSAVLLQAGLCAIGRPSNTGGAGVVGEYIRRRAGDRKVVVVGENDVKPDRIGDTEHGCRKSCDGCSWCWPGKSGAMSVAAKLAAFRAVVIMPPVGVKDVRDWSTKCSSVAAELIAASRCRS